MMLLLMKLHSFSVSLLLQLLSINVLVVDSNCLVNIIPKPVGIDGCCDVRFDNWQSVHHDGEET